MNCYLSSRLSLMAGCKLLCAVFVILFFNSCKQSPPTDAELIEQMLSEMPEGFSYDSLITLSMHLNYPEEVNIPDYPPIPIFLTLDSKKKYLEQLQERYENYHIVVRSNIQLYQDVALRKKGRELDSLLYSWETNYPETIDKYRERLSLGNEEASFDPQVIKLEKEILDVDMRYEERMTEAILYEEQSQKAIKIYLDEGKKKIGM